MYFLIIYCLAQNKKNIKNFNNNKTLEENKVHD